MAPKSWAREGNATSSQGKTVASYQHRLRCSCRPHKRRLMLVPRGNELVLVRETARWVTASAEARVSPPEHGDQTLRPQGMPVARSGAPCGAAHLDTANQKEATGQQLKHCSACILTPIQLDTSTCIDWGHPPPVPSTTGTWHTAARILVPLQDSVQDFLHQC